MSMRARRYFQRTGKKITINGSDIVGYDKSKVECFNCHKMGHFVRECRGPRNQDNRNRNQDSSRKTVNVEETFSKSMVAIDGAGFDWSFMADEEVPTNMALMAFSDSELEGYGPKASKSVCKDTSNEVKKTPDALLGEKWVSEKEKQTVFPTKIESAKQQEKPARKLVKFDHVQAHCNYHQKEGMGYSQKEDGIFISQDKYVAGILRKFGFTDVRTASTPMDTEKPLLKDSDGDDVNVHLYRSMIGSLMYLTSSRPDIMYLKGQPKLGLWYRRNSPIDLVAYSDSNYAGASLDRISTTGGCQFLGCRLISSQCKKKTVVATSSTEAEYVAAASCCGQVLWIQNQMLDYGGHDSKIPQSSCPPEKVGDEAVHKELGDRMERAATTTSSLEAEQDSGNNNRTQSMATLNEPNNTLGSGEDSMKLMALMEHCTKRSELGEGSTIPVESHHTPTVAPSTSQPHHSPTLRDFIRQETKVPQPSFPTQTHVADEAASTGVDDRHGGAATTVSGLEAGHGSGNIHKTPTMPHDSPLLRVYTLGSDEGRMQPNELMELVTKLSNRVAVLENDLKQTKKTYGAAFTKLIKKFKTLEKTIKSIKARRRAQFVVSDNEEEYSFNKGRKIAKIDEDPDISLVQQMIHHDAQTQGRQEYDLEPNFELTAPKEVYTAEPDISTANVPVSTAGAKVSTAAEV
ncbi:uncharacterized mitochondrial protein-like protein [Tanacetum coccineum]